MRCHNLYAIWTVKLITLHYPWYASKDSGSYLKPKPHIQHTHSHHLSTRTHSSTNNKSTHRNRMW